jgi:hypothetical protein
VCVCVCARVGGWVGGVGVRVCGGVSLILLLQALKSLIETKAADGEMLFNSLDAALKVRFHPQLWRGRCVCCCPLFFLSSTSVLDVPLKDNFTLVFVSAFASSFPFYMLGLPILTDRPGARVRCVRDPHRQVW